MRRRRDEETAAVSVTRIHTLTLRKWSQSRDSNGAGFAAAVTLEHMNNLEFTILVLLVSAAAGFLGSLTGLGGGVVITPVLTLMLGIDLRYSIGATLVSVIATSSGAASAYVPEGFSNIRIGMFLEIATTVGAVVGAYLSSRTPTSALAVIFGLVLLYSAYETTRPEPANQEDAQPDPLATRLRLGGVYPARYGPCSYLARRVQAGFAVMFGAGALSGLLGIGSGALKVIAMDQVMRLPFKVSTATSNFMIGVTAAASAGVYLRRGYIDPGLAMPVMLGVVAGSFSGARLLAAARTRVLRILFAFVVAVLALEMIYSGLSGKL